MNTTLLENEQYSFAIIPQNYAARIKKIKILIKSDIERFSNLELQEINHRDALQIPRIFIKQDGVYSLFGDYFKPQKNSVYFVQFDISINDKTEMRS